NKPTYTPNVKTGHNVIIINADKIELSRNKLTDKKYYRHSGYPGGLKERSANEMRNNYSERMIDQAVKGMLPKGPLGRKMQNKLHVYAGEHHRNNTEKQKNNELKG